MLSQADRHLLLTQRQTLAHVDGQLFLVLAEPRADRCRGWGEVVRLGQAVRGQRLSGNADVSEGASSTVMPKSEASPASPEA